jgi:hypothetical protein
MIRLLCCALAIGALNMSAAPNPELDRAFERLYSFDFQASRNLAESYISRQSSDPMGHVVQAATELYSELRRLNGLGEGFLADAELKSSRALKPSPQTRERFAQAVAASQRLCEGTLVKDPNNRQALLAMVMTSGLQRDYAALVDKKLRQSLEYIKAGQEYSTRLLQVDPGAADAYLNTGFNEYLLGSFPAVLRLVVKIDGVEGNKDKGFAQMEVTAKSGQYLRGVAQLMLASFYKKENRPADSARVLREMARTYPGNEAIRKEVARLDAGSGS